LIEKKHSLEIKSFKQKENVKAIGAVFFLPLKCQDIAICRYSGFAVPYHFSISLTCSFAFKRLFSCRACPLFGT